MPKLGKDLAEKVENAEDGFKPIEEGVYILQLTEDVEVKTGAKGPYWRWVFEIPEKHEDQELAHAGRKFFLNTSLSEAAFFKLKELFGAFGVPTDSETEDLVGRRIKGHITVRTIQAGDRKGELTNDVSKTFPLDHDETVEQKKQEAAANSGSSEDPLF